MGALCYALPMSPMSSRVLHVACLFSPNSQLVVAPSRINPPSRFGAKPFAASFTRPHLRIGHLSPTFLTSTIHASHAQLTRHLKSLLVTCWRCYPETSKTSRHFVTHPQEAQVCIAVPPERPVPPEQKEAMLATHEGFMPWCWSPMNVSKHF